MAKEKVEKPQSLEKTLYAAADKLIGAVMPHDYMKMVLGLIFLKYVSDRFDAKYKQLVAEGDGFEEEKDADAEHQDKIQYKCQYFAVVHDAIHSQKILALS